MTSQLERENSRWRSMMSRCHNPRSAAWSHYGGRGIKVCERWHDFGNYYADIMQLLGPCLPGRSIDRIDNDGDYEPGNVRWATPRQQWINSRSCPPRFKALWGPARTYTAAEVCKALHVTREELAQLVAAEELPMISGCVTETALEEYIARRLPEMAVPS